MKPTIGIVSFLLTGEYELSAGFKVLDDAAFSEFAIYDGEEPERGVCYLVDEPVGSKPAWRGRLAICLSDRKDGAPSPGEYHVIVQERSAKRRMRAKGARFRDLANAVGHAIRKFDSWAMEMQQLCFGAPDFREMLRLLETSMGLVSILVNRNLRYLAASDGFAAANPWYNESDTSMGIDMANQLMADDAFRSAILQQKPFFYHYYSEIGVDSYSACYNVTSTGRYEARLLIQSSTGERVFGQLALASYMGDLIAGIFARYIANVSEEPASPEFNRLLLDLARGAVVKADSLREILAVRGWEVEDRFTVHAFSFIEPENESMTRRYYQDRIAHLFERCSVFQHDGVLYCVRDLNLERRTQDEAAQDLVLFLRENLCHAGTSREFHDLRKLPTYLSEARCALRLGEASETMQWHFKFEDFTLNYIYDQMQREFNWEELAHPAIEALRSHDERHGTELLETACCFMECKYNVSRAAERLHIHRSSMIARLDRIASVAAIDWDNWDDRVHLALSFDLAGLR